MIVALGIVMYTASWTVFLMPHNLVGGGLSGLSAIIQYATGIPMGYFYFALNAILIVLGLWILGKGFGGKTIFAIILASFLLNLFPKIIPVEVIQTLSLENDKLICTVLGSVIIGMSIGVTMSAGGSTGGTDIIALIVNKYRNVSPGRLLLAIDVCIISMSLFVPSFITDPVTGAQTLMPFPEKVATAVYGFILITINAYVLDLYLSGSKQSVQALIFSSKYKELADAINNDLHMGVTMIPAVGWYSKKEANVLMVVTRKSDLPLLLKYVKFVDSQAFVSVGNVMGVYGQGFDSIKMKAEATTRVREDA